ncbi:hypothetical protein L2E82_39518 [Cichorium intybus]|uniref:Uncharacterized protein n=1 Tax=Cichorium intybus TaxID=13427 RepID=A0ACB9AIR3_CICIN|nr:hypothetical protein L2E82_39518 [Cichorium intybus]
MTCNESEARYHFNEPLLPEGEDVDNVDLIEEEHEKDNQSIPYILGLDKLISGKGKETIIPSKVGEGLILGSEIWIDMMDCIIVEDANHNNDANDEGEGFKVNNNVGL